MSSDTFSTAPPKDEQEGKGSVKERAMIALKARMVRAIAPLVTRVVTRIAPHQLGGQTLDDALRVAKQWHSLGHSTTLGYWDLADHTNEKSARIYLAAVEYLSSSPLDTYVSLKPPAMRFDLGLARALARAARNGNVRLHCDSHGPNVADRSNAVVDAMIDESGAAILGTTIPARWRRCRADVQWAIDRQLKVRVVKGQWPDPQDPKRDMQAGFLEVVEMLAGRVPHVAVATHDLSLAEMAIARLRAAGTSTELEQILGMCSQSAFRWAQQAGVGMRIYVPFGEGFLPNAVGVLRRNPRLALSVFRNARSSLGMSIGASP